MLKYKSASNPKELSDPINVRYLSSKTCFILGGCMLTLVAKSSSCFLQPEILSILFNAIRKGDFLCYSSFFSTLNRAISKAIKDRCFPVVYMAADCDDWLSYFLFHFYFAFGNLFLKGLLS